MLFPDARATDDEDRQPPTALWPEILRDHALTFAVAVVLYILAYVLGPLRALDSLNGTALSATIIRVLAFAFVLLGTSAVSAMYRAERYRREVRHRRRDQNTLHLAIEELDSERQRIGQLVRHTIDAQETERRYLASEIHDGLLQGMVAATYWVESMQVPQSDRDATDRKKRLLEALREAIVRGRAVISDIRPIDEPDIGLIAAVEMMTARSLASAHIKVNFAHPEELPPQQLAATTNVLRIVQEAITNVRKHSHATEVTIEMAAADGKLEVSVIDDGVGFEHGIEACGLVGHYGILAMRERARLFGGTLTMTSTPGQGTVVRGVFPIIEPD